MSIASAGYVQGEITGQQMLMGAGGWDYGEN